MGVGDVFACRHCVVGQTATPCRTGSVGRQMMIYTPLPHRISTCVRHFTAGLSEYQPVWPCTIALGDLRCPSDLSEDNNDDGATGVSAVALSDAVQYLGIRLSKCSSVLGVVALALRNWNTPLPAGRNVNAGTVRISALSACYGVTLPSARRLACRLSSPGNGKRPADGPGKERRLPVAQTGRPR